MASKTPGCASPATAAPRVPAWNASTTSPPNSGRPRPDDQGAQDLVHWQIRLRVADLDRIAATAQACGGQVFHGGVIELGAQASLLGAERALQLADPDGHQLQLVQG